MKIAPLMSNTAPIMMIYGPEGRGKTTFLSRTPKPLVFPHERGMPAGVTMDAVQDIDSFGGTMNALTSIYNEKPGDYQTLGFDTVDALEGHVTEHVCTKYGWKNIEQPPYGKGWIAGDDEWRRFLRAITAIRDKHGMTIVLVCHSTIETVNDPRAPSYTAYAPRLHKRARALVMDACDIVGFLAEDLRVLTDDGGFRERTRATAVDGRFLFLEGKPSFAAKNRFAMPAKLAIPLNLDFATLSKHWHKEASTA
jgi:AAA domain